MQWNDAVTEHSLEPAVLAGDNLLRRMVQRDHEKERRER